MFARLYRYQCFYKKYTNILSSCSVCLHVFLNPSVKIILSMCTEHKLLIMDRLRAKQAYRIFLKHSPIHKWNPINPFTLISILKLSYHLSHSFYLVYIGNLSSSWLASIIPQSSCAFLEYSGSFLLWRSHSSLKQQLVHDKVCIL